MRETVRGFTVGRPEVNVGEERVALSCHPPHLAHAVTSQATSRMAPRDIEIQILRGMTPAQKLAVMHALIRQAFELKAAAVRTRWPDLPDEQVRERTRALIAGDRP